MIAVKYWHDFNEDRKDSTRILVIYGVSFNGNPLTRLGIIPNFFCDQNARKIQEVTISTGSAIRVLDLNELSQLSDVDILIGIANPKYDMLQIVKSISDLFSEPCNIRIYYCNNLAEPFIAGKVACHYYHFIKHIIFDKGYCHMLRTAFINCNKMTDDDFRQLYIEAENMSLVFKDYVLCFEERHGKYISCCRNKRHTINQPDVYTNKIHVFGDSRENCVYSEDKFTVCSQLQSFVNHEQLGFRVENNAINGLKLPEIVYQIKNTKMKKGDIVFLLFPAFQSKEFVEFVLDAHNHCKESGGLFVFVDIPTVRDRIILSPWEEYLLQVSFSINDDEKRQIILNRLQFHLECIKNDIFFFNIDSGFYGAKETIFIDLVHWGDYGNLILANQLFEIIQSLACDNNTENKFARKEEIERKFLERIIEKANPGCRGYIEGILKQYPIVKKPEKVGGIVMNCNPFTKGHRYLIEQALKRVALLYIFVVEEDKSAYTFKDRFYLVKENTSDLANVIVVPSGKFIISSITFPTYFNKEEPLNQAPDMSLDLLTFALKIAPDLNITTRFVGEEPYCMVTKRYNEQMKNVLPKYGVDVVEIPRIGIGADIISASKVRLLIKERNFQDLEKYVPKATLSYLMQQAASS